VLGLLSQLGLDCSNTDTVSARAGANEPVCDLLPDPFRYATTATALLIVLGLVGVEPQGCDLKVIQADALAHHSPLTNNLRTVVHFVKSNL
jgi:hypothetical protein